MLQVPGNRIGMQAGFSAAQLRAIAELAILASFLIFQRKVLKQPPSQAQQWPFGSWERPPNPNPYPGISHLASHAPMSRSQGM